MLARTDASVDTPSATSWVAVGAEGRIGQQPPVELDHEVLILVRQLHRRFIMEGSTLQLEIGHIEPVRVRRDDESLLPQPFKRLSPHQLLKRIEEEHK